MPSTVSQALNGKGYVEAGTKKRILEAAAGLGYHPDARARGLRMGKGQTIGLFSAMPPQVAAGPSRLGFLMEITAVAAEAALNKGLALLLAPSAGSGFAPETFGIDGAIVLEPAADDPYVPRLLELNLPVVCLGRYPREEVVPYVDLHSAVTAGLLLEHLWENGSRCIALLIGDRERTSYRETEAVYQRFCGERGLTPLVRRTAESGGETGAHVTAAALLQECPEIDGLCALVDTFAVGAVQAARAAGRRVPEDLKIVTRYDGLRARTCKPPLTAVDLHLDAVASLGVELLFRRISGEDAPTRLTPPLPTLMPRESTALGESTVKQ